MTAYKNDWKTWNPNADFWLLSVLFRLFLIILIYFDGKCHWGMVLTWFLHHVGDKISTWAPVQLFAFRQPFVNILMGNTNVMYLFMVYGISCRFSFSIDQLCTALFCCTILIYCVRIGTRIKMSISMLSRNNYIYTHTIYIEHERNGMFCFIMEKYLLKMDYYKGALVSNTKWCHEKDLKKEKVPVFPLTCLLRHKEQRTTNRPQDRAIKAIDIAKRHQLHMRQNTQKNQSTTKIK